MCAIKMSVDMWLGNFDRKGIHCIPVGLNYPYSFMSGSCAEYHWIEMKNAFKEVLENAGVPWQPQDDLLDILWLPFVNNFINCRFAYVENILL